MHHSHSPHVRKSSLRIFTEPAKPSLPAESEASKGDYFKRTMIILKLTLAGLWLAKFVQFSST